MCLKLLKNPEDWCFQGFFCSFGYIDDKFYGQQKWEKDVKKIRYFAKIIQNKNEYIDYNA